MGGAQPMLFTERLVLRPFEERHLDAYTALLQAEPVRRSLHLPEDVGREEAWRQMAMWRGQWELRGTGQWALEERATGAFVGRAGTHRPERADWPGVEVGWALHPDHWGRGLATEAAAAAIDHAFTTPGASELWSVILPETARSAGGGPPPRLHAPPPPGALVLPRRPPRHLAPAPPALAVPDRRPPAGRTAAERSERGRRGRGRRGR